MNKHYFTLVSFTCAQNKSDYTAGVPFITKLVTQSGREGTSLELAQPLWSTAHGSFTQWLLWQTVHTLHTYHTTHSVCVDWGTVLQHVPLYTCVVFAGQQTLSWNIKRKPLCSAWHVHDSSWPHWWWKTMNTIMNICILQSWIYKFYVVHTNYSYHHVYC